MKKLSGTLLICGVLAVSCVAAVSAQPQDNHDQYHHDQNHQEQDQHDQDRHDHNRYDQDRHDHEMYDRGRREGWYKRGGHVPAQYNRGAYAVSDWRGNHLRQPPRGYHYVRSDNGDFLLVAVTTGVIASIIAGH